MNRACCLPPASPKLTCSEQPFRSFHSKAKATLKHQDRGDGRTQRSLDTQFSHLSLRVFLSQHCSRSSRNLPHVFVARLYQLRFMRTQEQNARTKLSPPLPRTAVRRRCSHPRLDKLVWQSLGNAHGLFSLDMFAFTVLSCRVVVGMCAAVRILRFFTVHDRFALRPKFCVVCKLCLPPEYLRRKIGKSGIVLYLVKNNKGTLLHEKKGTRVFFSATCTFYQVQQQYEKNNVFVRMIERMQRPVHKTAAVSCVMFVVRNTWRPNASGTTSAPRRLMTCYNCCAVRLLRILYPLHLRAVYQMYV